MSKKIAKHKRPRKLPEHYHDYRKDPFCITEYQSKQRPDLKWMVRSKLTGKWKRNFFKTEREAKTFVELKRIELLNEGKHGVMFAADLRVMAQHGADELKPFGKTLSDAVDFYVKHLEAQSRSVPVPQAVDELIDNRKEAGFSKRYCGDLRIRLSRFAKAFAARAVAMVTTKEIEGWLESLGVAPVTRNTFRRDVRTLFSFCTKRNYCADNPASSVTRAKELNKEVEVLTVEDATLLLSASSPEMLPYWAIGLFAGLRSSEILHLQWADVDFNDALITVRSAKTGKKRFVKMPSNLLAWLKPYQMKAGPVVPPVNFRRQTDEDKAAAGLGERWPVNAARHSFGSYWLTEFNDINALAVQMGNSPEVIEKHYRKAVRPKEAHRFWQIKPARAGEKKNVPISTVAV
jgi:integrase